MGAEVHNYTITGDEPQAAEEQVTQVGATVQDEGAGAFAAEQGSNTAIDVLAAVQLPESIDLVKKQELEEKFAATLSNPRFWAKPNRIKALDEVLVIPVFDDKSLQQFFNHAMDDLTNDAAKESSRTGKPVVMPTEEEGKAEAWSRYLAQLNKAIKRQLKKDGKPITDEIIEDLVLAELCKLTDRHGA